MNHLETLAAICNRSSTTEQEREVLRDVMADLCAFGRVARVAFEGRPVNACDVARAMDEAHDNADEIFASNLHSSACHSMPAVPRVLS